MAGMEIVDAGSTWRIGDGSNVYIAGAHGLILAQIIGCRNL